MEIDFGVGDFVGELGVASGGVGNGGGHASDGSGGSASAAAGGKEGDDAFALVGSECGRTTGPAGGVFMGSGGGFGCSRR